MFPGLSDSDFDAFLPQKQRSNVYNRERLEAKQRLLPLGRELATLLIGPDGAPLDLSASVEHPALVNHKQVEAQHLYFSRGATARRELDAIIDRARGVASLVDDPTPQRSHVFLAVSLYHDRVESSLRLHPEATVDRQNLVRKCSDPYELDRLAAALRALPAGSVLSLGSDAHDTSAITHEQLDAIVQRFAALPQTLALAGTPTMLAAVHTYTRTEAISAGAALSQTLATELAALLAIYRFCAWARDNDFVSVREALEKKQVERRQKGIVRGDAIRVVRGLFSGQRGTVQEVDARGAVRVLVGKRTLKLDAADLERG